MTIYYLAEMFNEAISTGEIVRVTSDGANRSTKESIPAEYASRWAMIRAASMQEARQKFTENQVVMWHS